MFVVKVLPRPQATRRYRLGGGGYLRKRARANRNGDLYRVVYTKQDATRFDSTDKAKNAVTYSPLWHHEAEIVTAA